MGKDCDYRAARRRVHSSPTKPTSGPTLALLLSFQPHQSLGLQGRRSASLSQAQAEGWRTEGHNRLCGPINSSSACPPWAQASPVPTLSLFPLFHAIRGGSYPGSCILPYKRRKRMEGGGEKEQERGKKRKEQWEGKRMGEMDAWEPQ